MSITNSTVLRINPEGALDVTDFLFDVARGEFAGISIDTKFGNNSDIDTGSTPEDVWEGGGLYTGQPLHSDAAETIEVFSSNGTDTSAGTGARTVRVIGLDANFDEQEEDLTLNGTTAVVSVNTYKRVFRMTVLTAGSGGANTGTLTVRHTATTANVFAAVLPGRNQTSVAAYTVPNGKTAYIVRFRAAIGRNNGSAGSAEYTFRCRLEGGVYRAIRAESITTNYPNEYTLRGAIVVPEKSDLLIRCEDVSDNNTFFSAAFEYVLVDN